MAALALAAQTVVPPGPVRAQTPSTLSLRAVGTLVRPSPPLTPPVLRGLIVHPESPFQFDFILDAGESRLDAAQLKAESEKLIKYFLVSLTMPEEELWVNLSPREQDRIIPEGFAQTEMGRQLLAQDYLLKQLTASLLYPEDALGKEFWGRVYARAAEEYGTADIPVETFHKVWIMPDKARIYENRDRAYVVESRLKVLLEEDYVAMDFHQKSTATSRAPVRGMSLQTQRHSEPDRAKNLDGSDPSYSLSSKKFSGEMSTALVSSKIKRKTSAASPQDDASRHIQTQILRELIIPAIEQEVNEGEQFAPLRQIYHSLILAAWYKNNLRQSILGKNYADQKIIGGLSVDDKGFKEAIYARYLEAFHKGVFNYIKEDVAEGDRLARETVPRQYFSGGFTAAGSSRYETAASPAGMRRGITGSP